MNTCAQPICDFFDDKKIRFSSEYKNAFRACSFEAYPHKSKKNEIIILIITKDCTFTLRENLSLLYQLSLFSFNDRSPLSNYDDYDLLKLALRLFFLFYTIVLFHVPGAFHVFSVLASSSIQIWCCIQSSWSLRLARDRVDWPDRSKWNKHSSRGNVRARGRLRVTEKQKNNKKSRKNGKRRREKEVGGGFDTAKNWKCQFSRAESMYISEGVCFG